VDAPVADLRARLLRQDEERIGDLRDPAVHGGVAHEAHALLVQLLLELDPDLLRLVRRDERLGGGGLHLLLQRRRAREGHGQGGRQDGGAAAPGAHAQG
jgi:hypothetical protein